MDNALIIDLVLAAVLAVFALLGARKGLIRSLMALVSVVVALIGATLLTAMFVEPVTDLVYPKMEERVLEQFERDIPSDALAAEDGDLSAGGLLPDELSEALGEALDTLKRFGVSDDAIDGVTKSVTDSAVSAAERAAKRRLCLPTNCTECTLNSPKKIVGKPNLSTKTTPNSAESKKSCFR